MKTYRIPRNVKSGLSFIGLEVKGWLLFLPTIVVFGGLALLLVPDLKLKIVLCVLTLGISYFSFMVDEHTGAMNYTAFTEFLKWYKSDKVIEPIWDESFDRSYTLQIKNKSIDKETLNSYKAFLKEHNESGESDEV